MKVLFPTDFSNAAENAFVFALNVARQIKAQITVLHIYKVPTITPWVEMPSITREVNELVTLDEFELFKSQIDVLKRIAIENNCSDIEINFSLRESDAVISAILDESNESNADIIIMGTTGASGLKEMLFGSVASKVMAESVCPVLLVPETSYYKGIQRIGLTLEYTPEEKELVQHALAVTKRMGAHLYCFHVSNQDQGEKPGKTSISPEDFKHQFDVSFHTYYSLDLEKGILNYCKENQIDVLVMRVHHRKKFREFISYHVAKKVAQHINIPLLTLHIKEEQK